MREVRDAGARIKFITDGDVAGAIAAAREGTGVDLLMGIGGTPEGIIAACALKCMGGALQGRLWPKDDEERQKAIDAGEPYHQIAEPVSTGSEYRACYPSVRDGEVVAVYYVK